MLLLVTLLSLLLVVVLMSLLLLLALVLLVLLLALLLFLKLPRGPPRGRLGLHVAQKSATREAGALDFGCGCACSGGGGGAARGAKGGRVANFSLTAPNLLWRWRWCWRSPEVRHAGGWDFALPRSQPRGRLGLYVAQRPATREAGALRRPEARHAGGWGFRFRCRLWCGAGRQGEYNFPLPHGPKSGVGVAKRPATRGRGAALRCPEASHAGCRFWFRLWWWCGAGRRYNFPLPHGPKSAMVVVLVLVLPRRQPHGGRLGCHVAQTPATREAVAQKPATREAGP